MSEKASGGENPLHYDVYGGFAPKSRDPSCLYSFKEHVIGMFCDEGEEFDDGRKANIQGLVFLAHGIYDRTKSEDWLAYCDELVDRLESEEWGDPLLNALYLLAGEFRLFMHETDRKKAIACAAGLAA